MMKPILLALCLYSINAKAQNVQQVINAERAFAAYAKDADTRSAFLKFMDTAGVVFNNGKPQNAIAVWTKNPSSADKLLWAPAFAGISSSGELGFTTGPWQYKKTLADTALASGVFNSIWRKNAQGEWKNIVDMGYAFTKPAYIEPKIKTGAVSPSSKSAAANVIELERQLIGNYRIQGNAAFKDVLADDCWLNINGAHPATNPQQHLTALATIPADLKMTPLGSGISKSGDLAYVYGSVENAKGAENYLRVWKRTPTGWKIVLQVLQWKV